MITISMNIKDKDEDKTPIIMKAIDTIMRDYFPKTEYELFRTETPKMSYLDIQELMNR